MLQNRPLSMITVIQLQESWSLSIATLVLFFAGSLSKTFYGYLIWLKWLVCASDTKNKQTIKNWAMKMTQTTQITSRKLRLFVVRSRAAERVR